MLEEPGIQHCDRQEDCKMSEVFVKEQVDGLLEERKFRGVQVGTIPGRTEDKTGQKDGCVKDPAVELCSDPGE